MLALALPPTLSLILPDPKPDPKPNQVRLSYARNDLLTWSSSGLEANMVKLCDAATITMPWTSPSLEP